MLRICLAGVTGWTGRALCKGILDDPGLRLTGAVARAAAGRTVKEALGAGPELKISENVREALAAGADVLIDYTSSSVVKANTLAALEMGVPVVIGTSGLTAEDFAEIEKAALARGRGVIASGNFSITATLVTRFALLAARHLPRWELLEYAPATKVDVPSGTVRELAERLGPLKGKVAQSGTEPRDLQSLKGAREARGAEIAGSRVHSIRLDSFVSSFEAVFGLPHERLTLRHDAGTGAEPYVSGTLLAAKKAPSTQGLVRGLDNLIFGPLG
jgi:4-hydroxy-tetrahydrodipicolinate reductase